MQCPEKDKYIHDIQEYLDGDLSQSDQDLLMEHLAECPACQKEFDAYQALRQGLSNLAIPELNHSLIDGILAQVQAERGGLVGERVSAEKISREINNESSCEISNIKVEHKKAEKADWKKLQKYIAPSFVAAAVLFIVVAVNGQFLSTKNQFAGDYLPAMMKMDQASNEELQVTESDGLMAGDLASANRLFMDPLPLDDFEMARPELEIGPNSLDISRSASNMALDLALFEEVDYRLETYEGLAQQVKSWADGLGQVFAADSYSYQGRTYILASTGQAKSEVLGLKLDKIFTDGINLYVNLEGLLADSGNYGQGDNFRQKILVSVEGEYPFSYFNDWQGPDSTFWMPEIYGINYIPPIHPASSPSIKLWKSINQETSGNYLLIQGIARVFEANLNYEIIRDNQEVLASGYITAAVGAPNWGYFEQELSFNLPHNIDQVQARLEVYEISARDGDKVNIVSIPLRLLSSGQDEGGEYYSYLVQAIDYDRGLVRLEAIDDNIEMELSNLEVKLANVKLTKLSLGLSTDTELATIDSFVIDSIVGLTMSDKGEVIEIFIFE